MVAITAGRLLFSALGAAMTTRLGIELTALQLGFVSGSLLAGWILIVHAFRTVPGLLSDGLSPAVTGTLEALPSSWAIQAVAAASAGDLGGTLRWLGGLVALLIGLAVATVATLRSDRVPAKVHHRRSRRGRVPMSEPPQTDRTMRAVVGKELRLWRRDPWRGRLPQHGLGRDHGRRVPADGVVGP